MAANIRRVLVFAQKVTDKTPIAVPFTQSVVDCLCPNKGDVIRVSARLEGEHFIIRPCESQGINMKRPPFCPVSNMSEADKSSIPKEIHNRGVDVGAVILLETSDGQILLTRRAQHLRIFPGVWVPPGGHIELNESIENAGFRELHEETGIDLQGKSESFESIEMLALWESVFPYRLSMGLPRRHHIVVYLHAKLKAPNTAQSMTDQICLDPQEVGACAWMSRDVIEAVVSVPDDNTIQDISINDLPHTISITEVNTNGKAEETTLETSVLLQKAPIDGGDVERVSTGTKFALSEWLKIPR